jgi:RNA polymerase sigma factor (sigma-70 family)
MEAIKLHERQSQLDDEVIVRRVVSGEKELFEILMRRYNQRLYRVLRGYLKDEAEIQDAMQNAYLKAFDKLFQFQGTSSFSTWLIRIGINEALVRLKDLKKAKVVSINSLPTERTIAISEIPEQNMNPEKTFIRQESTRLLEKAIENLPEKYRIVYILKEVEGLEYSQIEEIVGLTESNVKVRLHRAKNLLKDTLYKLSLNAEVFEFGNTRCDGIVNFVMSRI